MSYYDPIIEILKILMIGSFKTKLIKFKTVTYKLTCNYNGYMR